METSSTPASASLNSPVIRSWDWRAAFLALALVQISSLRLVETEWAPLLYFTQALAFLGSALGMTLGFSRFTRQAVMRLAAGYTLMLVPAQLLSAVERTGWLWHDILALADRLLVSLEQFVRNKPVDDTLFFISIVSLTYWLIGLAAGYWLTRHWDFLSVALPSGLAMLIVQAFDSPRAASAHVWELAVFLLVALLLLGRMYFLKSRSFWKRANFLLTDEAVSDMERGTLAVAVIVVFVAWSLPAWINGIKPAAKAWREYSQPVLDRFSNAVSALESPYAAGSSGDFYGAALKLGEQAAAGDTAIFSVELQETDFVPVRSYWKGRTYDLYSNGRWTTGETSSTPFVPTLSELTVEYPQARQEMKFTFTNRAERQGLIYTPAETVWVNRNANLRSRSTPDETLDVTAWLFAVSLAQGDQYEARSLIADPTVEELRLSGTEYPAWVTKGYLQVPPDIAPQLRELALEITASHETAYDKAQAITAYLRNEIEYQKNIEESPPDGVDPVLWVLFEYKKGFCMYYASAETLLLRSIGIPARMAVGFVEGDYNETERKYTVVYEDSHAWPEVFFPDIGWVEFEPTGNQFPIERPETRTVEDENNSNTAEEDAAAIPKPTAMVESPEQQQMDEDVAIGEGSGYRQYRGFLAPSLGLLGLLFIVFMVRRYSIDTRLPAYLAYQYERRGNIPPLWLRRWARWTTLSQIERAFQSVNLSLHWLGKPQAAHVTSQERAHALIQIMPEAREQTLALLEEYHKTMYTPHAGDAGRARKSALAILVRAGKTLIKETLQFLDRRYNQLK